MKTIPLLIAVALLAACDDEKKPAANQADTVILQSPGGGIPLVGTNQPIPKPREKKPGNF